MTDKERDSLSEKQESIRAKQALLTEVENELNELQLLVSEYFQKVMDLLETEP